MVGITTTAESSAALMEKSAEKKNKLTIPSWKNALAGMFAGALSRTVTAPIERIKLVMQLRHSLKEEGKAMAETTSWNIARDIYKHEGLFSFWRGNWQSVFRVSGTAAINFTMMDYYKRAAIRPLLLQPNNILRRSCKTEEQWDRLKRLLTSLLSGGMAGGTATTLLYPVEFLRTRLTADLARRSTKGGKYLFKGAGHAIWSIYRSDGIAGFFQGYGIALGGGIVYRVLYLGGYDYIKSEFPAEKMGWVERILIAQCVSLTAGTACYPIDSVRRRLMMQAGKPMEQRLYRNSFHCFYQIAKTEGIQGFFMGLGPNLARSVSGALLLVSFDAFKEVMA